MTRARDVANIDGVLTTTGDTYYASAAATPARLGIGSTGQVLTVAGGVPTWATPAGGGGMTLLSTTSWTSQTITLNSISQTYKSLYLTAENIDDSNGTSVIQIRLNGDTGNNYSWGFQSAVGTNSSENSSDINKIRTNIVGNDAALALTFPEYATTQKHLVYGNFAWSNGNYVGALTGYYNVAAAITSITLYRPDNGTFAGTIKLYGVN